MDSPDARRFEMIEMMYSRARGSFPGIAEVDVEQMLDMQASQNAVIVDVRTPAERAVSMIPGAISADDLETNSADCRDRPIICYCTIGHRSGFYTQRLQAEGLNAHNLKGAILAYTHCGRDLESHNGPTKTLHVHNPQAAQLIAAGYEGVW